MLSELNLLVGPIFAGGAAALLARALGCIATTAPRPHRSELEQTRRQRLRDRSWVMRFAEPLVRELEAAGVCGRLVRRSRVELSLARGGAAGPWRDEEFLAACGVAAAACGLAVGVAMFCCTSSTTAVISGFVAVVVSFTTQVGKAHGEARRRMAELSRGLPFATDLIALTMEAGAEFEGALATAVSESADSVVTEELSRAHRMIQRGESLEGSLEAMRKRLQSEDLDELVFSINSAQELGAPLSKALLAMADQMRLKRVQRAEAQAGRAQTQIVFPGMLIMFACLILVTAMFVLPPLYQGEMF